MSDVRYIKSFSKGQITIPKEIRKDLGMTDEFWLKMYIDGNRIVAEPVERERKEINTEEYRAKLLSIKGDWFDIDDYNQIRKEVADKVEKDWS